MRLALVVTAYALVLPAELPDKTALASLVLASRYRPLPVWLGAVVAFAAQCALAVTAGRLLALAPHRLVAAVAAVLFAAGAALTLRQGDEDVTETAAATGAVRIAAISCGVLFVAELGDFTQVATASLASRYAAPYSVFLGAWLALCTVSGLAVTVGQGLRRVVPFRAVRVVAASLFAVVAVLSAIEAIRS